MGRGKEIICSAKRVWNIYVSTFFRRNWGRIADFGYRSRKIWRFIKLAWKDQEWDYEYMLRVEKAKLEDMARYYEKHNITEHDWATARDIRICSRLIDIINGNDISYALIRKEKGQWDNCKTIKLKKVNTKNWKRFIRYGQFCEQLKDEDFRHMMEDDLRIEKAWNLYCKIRENNMRSWWN